MAIAPWVGQDPMIGVIALAGQVAWDLEEAEEAGMSKDTMVTTVTAAMGTAEGVMA